LNTGVERDTVSKVTVEGRSVMKSFVPLDNIDSVLSILSKIAIWGGLSDEERSKVFKRLEVGFFKKGEYIFQKGDQPSHIYIVKSGKIDLFISDRETVVEKETLTAGGCFGVASLMAMATHMGTAIAREDSEVLVLSRQSLLELRHEDIHLFALLMMNIAREIARRLKLTDDILLNYVHGHKGV
jgi:CRP/FNR family cyclic AMP-dependent transcriptional regulator